LGRETLHGQFFAATALLSAGLSGCGALPGTCREGITRGSAPDAALTSGDEALKVVFDQVRLPLILDGGDFLTRAKSHDLVARKPSTDAPGQTSQTFELASLAHAAARFWSDGACSGVLQKGDSEAMSSHILASLAARGQAMKPDASKPAARDGVDAACCNADPRPLALGVLTPTARASRRPAIVANLYRAKDGASDISLR
jgi:hypothetical protein